jgi:hypothetical protein
VGSHFFVTVDAETDVIDAGVAAIAAIRDEVERREGVEIPIVWFVRFQRHWSESVEGRSAAAFAKPPEEAFDGFALAKERLLELKDRGDEIGWHYHAYNWVQGPKLPDETRREILRADLASCAAELRRRHPEFPVASFRFGWFFVPDYGIYDDLKRLGIKRDASVRPNCSGPVAGTDRRYLEPLVTVPARIDGLKLFPFERSLLVHDWEVLEHDLGWTRQTEHEAAERRRRVAALFAEAAKARCLTYETAEVEHA